MNKFDTAELEISTFLLHTFLFLSEPVAYITQNATQTLMKWSYYLSKISTLVWCNTEWVPPGGVIAQNNHEATLFRISQLEMWALWFSAQWYFCEVCQCFDKHCWVLWFFFTFYISCKRITRETITPIKPLSSNPSRPSSAWGACGVTSSY